MQELAYVLPSEPQTGFNIFGQAQTFLPSVAARYRYNITNNSLIYFAVNYEKICLYLIALQY